jgi:hypothetical protein
MNNRWLLLLYILGITTVMFGVLVNFEYNWPDFVHTDYGFPFVWATHTTATIIGPVDKWNVDLAKLFLDIVAWLSVSYLIFLTFLWMTSRTKDSIDRS